MDDRTLLEFSAKACGIVLEWDGHPDEWQSMYYKGKTYYSFEPLSDDADAFNLVVSLGLQVDVVRSAIRGEIPIVYVYGYIYRKLLATEAAEDNGDSLRIATRLAITKAAASIGEQMK